MKRSFNRLDSIASPAITFFSPDSNILGDGVTNANVLTIGGSASANSSVNLYDGINLIGTTLADANGVWAFTTSALVDGLQNFTATSSLGGATSSSSNTEAITVDTVSPAAPVIASEQITGINQVVLSGTAEANSQITVFDGAVQIGTATTNPNGAWAITSGILSSGVQTFTATATDEAGNVSHASQAVSETVGTELSTKSTSLIPEPSPALLQSYNHIAFDDEFNSTSAIDMSNSHAAGYNWYLQNWFLTSSTDPSNVTISNGVLELGGGTGKAALVSAFASSSGAYTGTVFGNGAYMEASIKFDPTAGGNATAWPAFWGMSVEHIIDSSGNGASHWAGQGDGYAHFAETDIMEYMGELGPSQYVGAIHDWSGTYTSGTGWQYNIANYGNAFINLGSVDWSAYHTYGLLWVPQEGSTPGHANWYFDGQAMTSVYWLGPTTSTSLPGSSDGWFTSSSSGQATDTYSILDSQHLALSLQTDSSWPMYVDWVRVWQAGSTQAAVVAAPVISSYSPDSGVVGDGTTNAKALVLTGTAAAHGTELVYDGTTWLGSATADSTGAWTFTTANLADGVHSFTAMSVDASGNASVASAALAVTIDTVAPTIAISSESYSNGNVTLAGSAGEANDHVFVYDGTTLVGTTTTGSGGAWSFTTRESNTVHTYSVTAVDAAGNVGNSINDAIMGTGGADTLTGTAANDIIVGNGGNDKFVGGGGADLMVAGSGSDIFTFKAVSDSTPASFDTISHFDHTHDVILFSGISGINSKNGIASFQGQLTGTGNLNLHAHSIAYVETGGNTIVLVNNTGAAETVTSLNTHQANMQIVLTGTHLGLTSSDFHLA